MIVPVSVPPAATSAASVCQPASAVSPPTADAGWQTDAVDVAAGGTETGTIIAEGALAAQQLELRAWHSGAASAAEVVYGLLSTALLPDRP